jgi:hypothetical protein
MLKMFENTTNPAARIAIAQAHASRGAALADAWNWLFGGKIFR